MSNRSLEHCDRCRLAPALRKDLSGSEPLIFAFVVIGSQGDLTVFLSLALDHTVVMLAEASFRQIIETFGLEFRALEFPGVKRVIHELVRASRSIVMERAAAVCARLQNGRQAPRGLR